MRRSALLILFSYQKQNFSYQTQNLSYQKQNALTSYDVSPLSESDNLRQSKDQIHPSVSSEEMESIHTLEAVGIDLYHSYRFVQDYSKIKIITDIQDDMKIETIRESVEKGIVDVGIVSIISEIKEKGCYSLYQNKEAFIHEIEDFLQGEEKVLIYYSGHGKNGNLILPEEINQDNSRDNIRSNKKRSNQPTSKKYFEGSQFIRIIKEKTQEDAEILMMMDCCKLNGLLLPYYFNSPEYELKHYFTNTKDQIEYRKRIYTTQNIISIMNEADSLIINHGSLFTRYIFLLLISGKKSINIKKSGASIKYLTHPYIDRYLKTKYGKINHKTGIYVSSPMMKKIWSWVIGYQDQLSIKYDYQSRILEIERKG